MRNAIDFSYARPTPDEVAGQGLDILVYTGPARPDKAYLDAMRAAGVAVTLIQESDPNRSQQGRAAGVADAQYADSRADEVGHPATASIAYVVSDGNAGDPNSGADRIAAYAAGVASVSRRPFFFYGNQYACDAAMSGAPSALGTWIPSTWGRGSLMTQEANLGSPVGDTDLNTVHAHYTTADAPPAPPKTIGDDDVTYEGTKEDGSKVYWKIGFGDLYEVPAKVAGGEVVNGHGAPVPLSGAERIALGLAVRGQADAYMARFGLTPKK